MLSYDGLRPSEVVHLTIPDPAEQAPLVARSVTPPSPSGRGGTTLLWQRAPRSCTVLVMPPPPMNTPVRVGETIEGSRTMRNRPYPVLKCSINRAVISWGDWATTRLRADPAPLGRACSTQQHKTLLARCRRARNSLNLHMRRLHPTLAGLVFVVGGGAGGQWLRRTRWRLLGHHAVALPQRPGRQDPRGDGAGQAR